MGKRIIEPLSIGEDTIYIEVSEIDSQGESGDGFEDVSAIDDLKSAGEQIHGTIRGLSRVVVDALKESEPSEWSLEVNLGFSGKAGIPFITEGAANGAIKVKATWTRGK